MQRTYRGLKYGFTFSYRSPGKKPSPFTCFHRRPRQYDSAEFFFGKPKPLPLPLPDRSCLFRPTYPEHDVVRLYGLDIGFLGDRFRSDGPFAAEVNTVSRASPLFLEVVVFLAVGSFASI